MYVGQVKRCALLVLCLLALPAGAEANQPTIPQAQRAIGKYVRHLARDYRPAGVVWQTTWVRVCERDAPLEPTYCGYGMEGTRNGTSYNCAGVADVHYRKGRPFGWGRVLPTDIVGGRRYKIEPELFFECWGPESKVIRYG